MATTKATDKNKPAADVRTDATDEPVTELATVDGSEKVSDLKDMAGVTGGDDSQAQKDAYEGLKNARDNAKNREKNDINPHADEAIHHQGPGNEIG